MITEVKMYSGKCDNCGEVFEDAHHGWTAFVDEGILEEYMSEEGWYVAETSKGVPNKHYCENCWSMNDDDEIVIDANRKKQPH